MSFSFSDVRKSPRPDAIREEFLTYVKMGTVDAHGSKDTDALLL